MRSRPSRVSRGSCGGGGGGSALSLEDLIMSFDPVGYWKLDETTGTQADDSSGNARHGTYTNATLNDQDGHATFSAGYVEVSSHADFNLGLYGGLTCWGLFDRTSGSWYINKAASSGSNYEWGMNVGGSFQLQGAVFSSAGGAISTSIATGVSAPTAGWTTMGNTFSARTLVKGKQVLAVDGEISTHTETNTVSSGYVASTGVLRLGDRADSGTGFTGAMAECFVTQSVLSEYDFELLHAAAVAAGY